MTDVAIIDIGAGNIRSISAAFWRAGAEVTLISQPEEVLRSVRLVLPGVGNAANALERLRASGIAEALGESVLQRGHPFLGICVGMQVLAGHCSESRPQEGLGWYPGNVRHLAEIYAGDLTVPHVGFSDVTLADGFPLAGAFRKTPAMYFNHMYGLAADPDLPALGGTVTHGGALGACYAADSWIAVQFHPEKSQQDGAKLIDAFLDWTP